MVIDWSEWLLIKTPIFVAKTRNYDIFVAKIYDYALIDSFWRFCRLTDSPTSYATLNAHIIIWLDLTWNRNEQTDQYISNILYYQHADIVSGEGLSTEVLVVAKSGAVCIPNVVLWRFTTAIIKCHPKAFFCHVINGLYAIAPLTWM